MKSIVIRHEFAGYNPAKNFEMRPFRMMTNGQRLLDAVKLGILKLETVEKYDNGFYCGVWYIFTDAKGRLTTMFNSVGFGFNTWDMFEIDRDIQPLTN